MSVLEVAGVSVDYHDRRGSVRAVDCVDLVVGEGQTVGLVGESGSGKSSLARAIVGLTPVATGHVLVDGVDVTRGGRRTRAHLRGRVQLVFQDPYSSLNPRMSVAETIEEALTIHRRMTSGERRAEITRLLDLVGLGQAAAASYPFEFSGGQRQRIAIARALAVRPRLLIADEVTSALDVSVQASILNLLREIQREFEISYLVISHNLSVVRYLSDLVGVMYFGRIVEVAPAADLFERPCHPYTRALLESLPRLAGPRVAFEPLEGDIPDPHDPPSGCRFRTRCPIGPAVRVDRSVCVERDPQQLVAMNPHRAACHFPIRTHDAMNVGVSR